MQQNNRVSAQQTAHTARLMSICSQAPAQRSMDDIWFIRDRLHERSNFFRLWPSQLQQLICRLARPMHWVQNEVASQANKPCDVAFILEGKAAVAVRSSPGTSLQKDIAVLQSGDTFGEISLLGAQRSPAFIVVRSKELLALAVDAQALAHAMLQQQQQAQTQRKLPKIFAPADSQQQQQAKQQQTWVPEDAPMNVDALYKLIGEPRHPVTTILSSELQQQIAKVQQVQLQAAADAEALTVGSWMALPHEFTTVQHSGRSKPRPGESTCRGAQPPEVVRQQQGQVPGHRPPKTSGRLGQFNSTTGPQLSNLNASATGTTCDLSGADDTVQRLQQNGLGSRAVAAVEDVHCAVAGTTPERDTDMYRARHSAILHMAVVKASSRP